MLRILGIKVYIFYGTCLQNNKFLHVVLYDISLLLPLKTVITNNSTALTLAAAELYGTAC